MSIHGLQIAVEIKRHCTKSPSVFQKKSHSKKLSICTAIFSQWGFEAALMTVTNIILIILQTALDIIFFSNMAITKQ